MSIHIGDREFPTLVAAVKAAAPEDAIVVVDDEGVIPDQLLGVWVGRAVTVDKDGTAHVRREFRKARG